MNHVSQMIIQMNKSLCPAAGKLAAQSCSSVTVYSIKQKLSEKELNQHFIHKKSVNPEDDLSS